jgi:hypothetical protein
MKTQQQYLDSLDARMREFRLELAADLVIGGKAILPKRLEEYRKMFDNYMIVARAAGIPEIKQSPADLEKIAAYHAHLSKVG